MISISVLGPAAQMTGGHRADDLNCVKRSPVQIGQPVNSSPFCIAALHNKCFTKRLKYEHIVTS
ncbi:hypothetical protein NE852_26505 (plasmid) [Rhizobium sp. Pop5]|uniref:hypothetical protein n=1 Tax=Rhizobium sp. Pop5 TaxID=1223565 RepID=UPI000FFB2577|nr:hypothetical protein [Rhizobium sp. Pop5]UVD59978.1 hypothetical protein NE852_26505 [Rhizobium sp. Pop5]